MEIQEDSSEFISSIFSQHCDFTNSAFATIKIENLEIVARNGCDLNIMNKVIVNETCNLQEIVNRAATYTASRISVNIPGDNTTQKSVTERELSERITAKCGTQQTASSTLQLTGTTAPGQKKKQFICDGKKLNVENAIDLRAICMTNVINSEINTAANVNGPVGTDLMSVPTENVNVKPLWIVLPTVISLLVAIVVIFLLNR